ncbi:DUF1127 domain-containing protein [Roseomonas arctica]|uniref:DUF1127 domain-containing protein n=2 Tax=Plastoroseomonas arctica TaxID=1509237 RepID=A0AAF1K148_9PROT|nr:DUF1127 domain-containing protein [Plastoroseomonas arctica]
MRDAAEREALRVAATTQGDALFAQNLRQGLKATATAVATLVRAVVTFPAKRRAYSDLLALTSRELADIGLTRADIPRVFDPDFVAAKRKAPVALRSGRPQHA